jgi:hypothetical protein
MSKTILGTEHRAAISRAMTGKKQSEETKQKRRESLKKTYDRRKKKTNPLSSISEY